MSENGVAVDGGAAVIEGGVAFGAFSLIEEETALVGGNGVALNAGDTIADDGSALVVGDGNITATAEDDAAVVGGTGSALYVDEADDWTVFGGENKVSMAELDQEVEMEDGGPVLSAGAWTPEETPGTFDPDERQSNPSVTTGDIGLAGSGISINGMHGLNAFNVNTGAMNQGGIHTVAASVGTLTMN
jgi:hypothetical protein